MTGQSGGDPHADWTPIVVRGPLPMDVAGTLMKLIGTAYPNSLIDGSGKHSRGWLGGHDALVMLIDPKDRAKPVSKKKAAELKDHDEGFTAEFVGFRADEDGASLLTSGPEELTLFLGEIAHTIFTAQHEEVTNYLEWEVHTEDSAHRYVLAIARTKGQTPHALRTRAEKELEDLRARVRALGDDLEESCPGDAAKHRTCVGARVHALLGE